MKLCTSLTTVAVALTTYIGEEKYISYLRHLQPCRDPRDMAEVSQGKNDPHLCNVLDCLHCPSSTVDGQIAHSLVACNTRCSRDTLDAYRRYSLCPGKLRNPHAENTNVSLCLCLNDAMPISTFAVCRRVACKPDHSQKEGIDQARHRSLVPEHWIDIVSVRIHAHDRHKAKLISFHYLNALCLQQQQVFEIPCDKRLERLHNLPG